MIKSVKVARGISQTPSNISAKKLCDLLAGGRDVRKCAATSAPTGSPGTPAGTCHYWTSLTSTDKNCSGKPAVSPTTCVCACTDTVQECIRNTVVQILHL